MDVALRLSVEGREGEAVGTIFVLGHRDELESHLKQDREGCLELLRQSL